VNKIDENYKLLNNEIIEVNIGSGLIKYFTSKNNQRFLKRNDNMKSRITHEYGIIIPKIRYRDDPELDNLEYVIKIQSIVCGRFKFLIDHIFCIPETDDQFNKLQDEIECVAFNDPCYAANSLWIKKKDKKIITARGIKTFDIHTLLMAHLTQTIISNLSSVLTLDSVSSLIDSTCTEYPLLLSEMNKNGITLGHITRILRNLLERKIPIHNLPYILEHINEAWLVIDEKNRIADDICEKFSSRSSEECLMSQANSSMHNEVSLIKDYTPVNIAIINSTTCGLILRYYRGSVDPPVIAMKRSQKDIYELIVSAVTTNIPVINDSDLANRLFRLYEEDDEIDPEFYLEISFLFSRLNSHSPSLLSILQ